MWKQKSRELWLFEGDKNTKFFHASTVIRRRRNFIAGIAREDDLWIKDRVGIGNYFVQNFVEMFSSSNPPLDAVFDNNLSSLVDWVVSCEDNLALCTSPNELEIKETVWSIHPLKSPRLDGM